MKRDPSKKPTDSAIRKQADIIRLAANFLHYRQQESNQEYYNKSCDKILAEQFGILLWKYTEANGKYHGCPFWSVRAVEALMVNGSVNKLRSHPTAALRHEHLVPRKILIEMLFKLTDITFAQVEEIFKKYCIGIVITREEDEALSAAGLKQCMPNVEWLHDPWHRYRALGGFIEIHQY